MGRDFAAIEDVRRILGSNFFGLDDWNRMFNIPISSGFMERIYSSGFPWSERCLQGPCPFEADKMLRETHFGFLEIQKMSEDVPTLFRMCGLEGIHPLPDCYIRKSLRPMEEWGFAYAWRLLRRETVPGSSDRVLRVQESMMPPEYELPYVTHELIKNVLIYRLSESYINCKLWTRCKEIPKIRCRTVVGYFGHRTLNTAVFCDDTASPVVGVGASRRSGV
jgi:hypothetical protein